MHFTSGNWAIVGTVIPPCSALDTAMFFLFEALSYPLTLDEVKNAKNLIYKPAATYPRISDVSMGRCSVTFSLITSSFPAHICYQPSN